MKSIILSLALAWWAATQILSAQNAANGIPQYFFDPERDPVAVREGEAIHLFVSEYILAKSVRARVGRQSQIDKVYQLGWSGKPYLIVEGHYPADGGPQYFKFNIPLTPDASGKFLYAARAGQSCNGPCGNCGTDPSNCGCCTTSSNGREGQPIQSPLLKVTTGTE